MDTTTHGEEVKELWEAYTRKENRRVPITFASDEQLWLKVTGHSFLDFYTDPKIMLKVQLEGARWFRDKVVGDMAPGYPDGWNVGVRAWMSENEFFGCKIVYQDNDYAWALPLELDRDSLLKHIADLDPDERVKENAAYKMYLGLKDLAEGMKYLDRSVGVAAPGGGCHGIFTKAAEIRGLNQICLDLYEAPEFVEELLRLVTEKTFARMRAWNKLLTGKDEALFPSPWGTSMCDDSLQMISADQYEQFVLPCHERYYSTLTTGRRSMHLCGRASHLYEVLRRKLDITTLNGPGAFVDHGEYLERLGPDFSFEAQMDHSVLSYGSESEIDQMMQGLLRSRAKLPGRFQIMGYIHRDTPLAKVEACYRAGRTHGRIGLHEAES